jgi:hypothetical protein
MADISTPCDDRWRDAAQRSCDGSSIARSPIANSR